MTRNLESPSFTLRLERVRCALRRGDPAAAQRHSIDPALLAGLVRQESNFDPTPTPNRPP
jgi:soluble lytic murein transglycosylase-like protein